MNSDFKNRCRKNWFVYLVFAILCPLLVDWGASARTALKSNEKVTLFIGAKSVDEEALRSAIFEGDEKSLQEVKVLTYDPNDSSFLSYLTSAGVVGTDFVILPEGSYNSTIIKTYFLPLDIASWNDALGTTLSPLSLDGVDEGFLLYDEEQGISFGDAYFSYQDEKVTSYGLFINRKSVNFQSVFSISSLESDHALKALRTLLRNKP